MSWHAWATKVLHGYGTQSPINHSHPYFNKIADKLHIRTLDPESPSLSCLDADASGGDDIVGQEHDDPYNNFFQSQSYLSSASAGSHQSLARRFWNVISRNRPPAHESIPQARPKRSFFGRRARSNSLPEPATITPNQLTPEAKIRAGKEDVEGEMDDGCSANAQPGARQRCKGKEREGSLLDTQSLPHNDHVHPAGLDSEENRNLWKQLIRARGKDPTSAEMAPAMKRPEVVEVYAVRGLQGYVALTPKWKKRSSTVTYSVPLAAAHASGSSPAGPSLQGSPGQSGTSLQAASGQGGSSSPAIVGHVTRPLRITEGPSSHASPSHFVTSYHTSHDSDSRSSIEGSFNRFLDKICFPCGHFHDDD
ncbi:hypothetical protein DFH29DRAFT_1073343 [Suillus ampliporus]|nr:hypothetical protein DFH29DRAFT_1073343 [Suillus ampliporus]